MQKWLLAALAMLAFAGNSLLNRDALAGGWIAADAFALIRVFSGACALLLISTFTKQNRQALAVENGSWLGALSLIVYMLGFSWAYLSLDAGFGAMLLFGAVQFTMIGYGLFKGEALTPRRILALVIALAAFAYLLAPDQVNASFTAVGLMLLAGFAWGVYSILGKHCIKAQMATTGNFVRASILLVPLALWLLSSQDVQLSTRGVVLALLSGVVTSALGYSLWYAIVRKLTSSQAAVMQLSVPPLALVLGALLLGEAVYTDVWIASFVLLAAIALFITKSRGER